MSKTRGKRELIPPEAAARTGGKRIAPISIRPFGALDAVLIFICGALLLLIFTAAILPRLTGCSPYAIASGSMAPTLARGDLAFVQETDFDALKENDIIVFQTETGPITHRVYSIDWDVRTLRTKADASPYLDPLTVSEEMLVGRVLYKLPLLGFVSLSFGGGEALT